MNIKHAIARRTSVCTLLCILFLVPFWTTYAQCYNQALVTTPACTNSSWTSCSLPECRDLYPANTPLEIYSVVHLIRQDDGTGPTVQDVEDMMQKLQDDLDGTTAANYALANPLAVTGNQSWTSVPNFDTQIRLCWEIRVYDNSCYLYESGANLYNGVSAATSLCGNTITSIAAYPGSALNVIINEHQLTSPVTGTYSGDPDFVKVEWASCTNNPNNRDLAHEVGHYFGLAHTQNIWGCSGELSTMSCASRNTFPLSDRHADTDADPELVTQGLDDCDVNDLIATFGTGITCSGNFSPYYFNSRFNFMQYGFGECHSRFSPQQARKMRCVLNRRYPNFIPFRNSLGACPCIPVPDFAVSPRNTCVGEPVNFTDNSLNATSWLWNFGDGSTSNAQSPVHSYNAAGTYTITLEVTCTGNTQTLIRTNYVNVVQTGLPVPYTQNFDDCVFPPSGWEESLNSSWRRLEGLLYNRYFCNGKIYTGCTNNTGNSNAYADHDCIGVDFSCNEFVKTSVSPTGYTVNTQTGDNNGSAACSAGIGEIDQLMTPIFSLSGVNNPVMTFHLSHLPSGDGSLANNACDMDYPGFKTGPLVGCIDTYEAANNCRNSCYWSHSGFSNPGCVNMSPSTCTTNAALNVYYSLDCGSNWISLVSYSGATLNTVAGNPCGAFGYVPLTTGVWDEKTFNLCGTAGPAKIRFMFEMEGQRYTNNVYVDDFYIGPDPNSANQIVLNPVIVDDCGLPGGNGTGSIDLTGTTGGFPPYLYEVAGCGYNSGPPTTNPVFTGLVPCAYDVVVTDNQGNCYHQTVTVGQIQSLNATATVVDASCSVPTGQIGIALDPPYGVANYVFEIVPVVGIYTGPQTVATPNFTFNSIPPGTYTVYYQDGSGNCGSQQVTVNQVNNFTPTFTTTSSCVTNLGSITITSPTGPNYTYSINTSFGNNPTPGVYTDLPLGIPYTVTVININNGDCGTITTTLSFPPPLNVAVTGGQNETCALNDGYLTFTVVGGSGTYNWTLKKWINAVLTPVSGPIAGGVSHTFTGLDAGSYEVCVDDGNACGTLAGALGGPPTINTTVSVLHATCNVTTGSVGVTVNHPGTMTFTLTPLFGGAAVPPQTGTNPGVVWTGVVPGTYELFVTDNNGSCYLTNVVVNANVPTLTFTQNVLPEHCGLADGQITLTFGGTGPYNIVVTDPNLVQTTYSGQSSPFVLPNLANGNYTFDVTDNNGACLLVGINVPEVFPQPNLGPDEVLCAGGQVTLCAQTGFASYSWNGGGTNACTTVTSPGIYTCTVTDGFGCQGTDDIEVLASTIAVNLGPDVDICQGSFTTLDAGPGFLSYLWTPGGATTQTINVTTAGTYTVAVTDADACTATDDIIVNVLNPTPTLLPNYYLCPPGNSVVLDAGPGFASYLWSTGATSQTITVSATGTYSVTVSNTLGCTGSATTTVGTGIVPILLSPASYSVCAGQPLTLGGIPQTSNTSVQWYDPNGIPLTPLGANTVTDPTPIAGTYTYVGTHSTGCTSTNSVVVTIDPLPVIPLPATSHICDITLGVDLDAGPGFVSYSWSTGATSQIINVNVNGPVSVTVTDANGCQNTATTNVVTGPYPTVVTGGTLNLCPGAAANLSCTVTPGGSTVDWSDPNGSYIGSGTSITVNSPIAGNYSATATHPTSQCLGTATQTVNIYTAPAPILPATSYICDITIGVTVTVNPSFASYLWSNGATTQSTTTFTPGPLSVTVTDGNGCTATTSTNVVVATPPTVNGGPDVSTCAGNAVTLTATASPGTATTQWYDPGLVAISPAGPTVTVSPTVSGNYTVVATDPVSGCTSSDVVYVEALNCCSPGADVLVIPVPGGTSVLSSSLPPISSGSTIYVHDELIVDNALILTNCTIEMNTNARITVNPFMELSMYSCTVQACDDMWEGIFSLSSDPGILLDDCRIYDGIDAVVTQNDGLIHSFNTEYDRNHRHIWLDNSTSGGTPCDMFGNQFLGGTISLAPWTGTTPFVGVDVDNCPYAQIGYSSAGVGTHNLFDGLEFGIRAVNSEIAVNNNHFENIQPAFGLTNGIAVDVNGTSAGSLNPTRVGDQSFPYSHNNFDNCRIGVRVQNNCDLIIDGNNFLTSGDQAIEIRNHAFQNLVIRKNKVLGWQNAIWLDDLNDGSCQVEYNVYEIANNTFPATGIKVTTTTGNPDYQLYRNDFKLRGYGITMDNSTKVEAYLNEIHNYDYASGINTDFYGIRVTDCGAIDLINNFLGSDLVVNASNGFGIHMESSPESRVSCNDVNFYSQSIVFVGDCDLTPVEHNSMQYGAFGIILRDCGKVGPQGAPGTPSRNRWLGTWPAGTRLLVDASDGTESMDWYVATNLPTENVPSPGVLSTTASPCSFNPISVLHASVGKKDPSPCLDIEEDPGGGGERKLPVAALSGEQFELNLYPNPTSGMVTVQLLRGDAPFVLEVKDLMGHTLGRESGEAKGMYETKVDLSKHAAGIYFLVLEINGETYTRKIVLAKH